LIDKQWLKSINNVNFYIFFQKIAFLIVEIRCIIIYTWFFSAEKISLCALQDLPLSLCRIRVTSWHWDFFCRMTLRIFHKGNFSIFFLSDQKKSLRVGSGRKVPGLKAGWPFIFCGSKVSSSRVRAISKFKHLRKVKRRYRFYCYILELKFNSKKCKTLMGDFRNFR